jgi:hypothetical protein
MDLDYRFDKRDGQHKLLDFNPRIGGTHPGWSGHLEWMADRAYAA